MIHMCLSDVARTMREKDGLLLRNFLLKNTTRRALQ